jgi:hypothetical protein
MASKKQTIISRPLARSENLVVESVGDETVIYDTVAHVAHALTPVAAAVFTYADGKNTAAEIAELASYRLGTTVTEADVVTAIDVLDANSLIDGPVLDVHTGISRRTALKTFAAAGAGSMLVMSIATAAAQACITCSSGQLPPSDGSFKCSTNTYTSGIPSGPVSSSGWTTNSSSDCRLCNTGTGSGGGVYPCQTTGSSGACCCAPCDGSSSYCCQPICVDLPSGGCPSYMLPLGHTVGGENGYPQIACPTGYGAYQALATDNNGTKTYYTVKCCKEGTATNGVPNNDGSQYCQCHDSAGTCGYYVSSTNRGKTTYTCQIYT